MKKRRLAWYGHLLRLPEESPAKKSSKKPRGGHKQTWLKLITKHLETVKVMVNGAGHLDRYDTITNYHELLAKIGNIGRWWLTAPCLSRRRSVPKRETMIYRPVGPTLFEIY